LAIWRRSYPGRVVENPLRQADAKMPAVKKDQIGPIEFSLPQEPEDTHIFFCFCFIVLLFICAYKAWVISPPCPHPLPLPLTPSIPSRNYFALISNFVIERV
jgi:hypothetical protein